MSAGADWRHRMLASFTPEASTHAMSCGLRSDRDGSPNDPANARLSACVGVTSSVTDGGYRPHADPRASLTGGSAVDAENTDCSGVPVRGRPRASFSVTSSVVSEPLGRTATIPPSKGSWRSASR